MYVLNSENYWYYILICNQPTQTPNAKLWMGLWVCLCQTCIKSGEPCINYRAGNSHEATCPIEYGVKNGIEYYCNAKNNLTFAQFSIAKTYWELTWFWWKLQCSLSWALQHNAEGWCSSFKLRLHYTRIRRFERQFQRDEIDSIVKKNHTTAHFLVVCDVYPIKITNKMAKTPTDKSSDNSVQCEL